MYIKLLLSCYATYLRIVMNRTCTNCTVRADLPTPPSPSTTILYSLILVCVGRDTSRYKNKGELGNLSCLEIHFHINEKNLNSFTDIKNYITGYKSKVHNFRGSFNYYI